MESTKFHPELLKRDDMNITDEDALARHMTTPKNYDFSDDIEKSHVELALNSFRREKFKVNL